MSYLAHISQLQCPSAGTGSSARSRPPLLIAGSATGSLPFSHDRDARVRDRRRVGLAARPPEHLELSRPGSRTASSTSCCSRTRASSPTARCRSSSSGSGSSAGGGGSAAASGRAPRPIARIGVAEAAVLAVLTAAASWAMLALPALDRRRRTARRCGDDRAQPRRDVDAGAQADRELGSSGSPPTRSTSRSTS